MKNLCHSSTDVVTCFVVVATSCLCFFLIADDELLLTSQGIIHFTMLWMASLLGGFIFQTINIPILGSLLAGLVLKNLFDFDMSLRFDNECRTVGLCTILIISSVEIDIDKVLSEGMICLKLTVFPGMIEAMATGTAAFFIFNMPVALALTLGYTLAAVSPAVVVPGMLQLKQLGYGVDKGIPSLVIAAASLDDIVAITGFTICMGVALGTDSDIVLSAIIHGPMQIGLGVGSGFIGGILLALTMLCSKAWQRSLLAFELGLIITYCYKRINFNGAGAISTFVMGAVAQLIWKRKSATECVIADYYVITASNCASNLREIGDNINVLWEIAVKPLLFASIGAAFDINALPKETMLKSFTIIIIGIIFRVLAAYFSAGGRHLSNKERYFVALAWLPKATVQAALCSLPLSMIENQLNERDNYEMLLLWGQQIMSTAILAIIITAPLGLISIQVLGSRLLSRVGEKEADSHRPEREHAAYLEKETPVSA